MGRQKGAAKLSMDQLRKFVKEESGVGNSFKTINITANGGTASGNDSIAAEVQEDTLNLIAGANITLTGDQNSDTITITGVSTSSNSFETVSLSANGGTVTGDSSMVAESGTDTLTIVAGSNVTLNGSASRDQITISSDVGNFFKTITLATTGTGTRSGDASIVADAVNDTLTLTAGNNIAFTGNASGDGITIAAADYGDAGITTFSVDDDSGNDVGNLRFDAGTGISLSDSSDKLTVNVSDAVATQLKISGNTSGDTTVSIDNHSTANTIELAGGTNITLTGNNSAGTISIAAPNIGAPLSTEQVQDIVGAMFSGNTETNVTATYQDSDGTIDLVAPDSSTNAFSIISVSGQSNISADSIADTLTLAAGANMIITNNPDTDTITFSSTGGGQGSGTGDVLIAGTPVDNQLAIWTSSTTIEGTGSLLYDGSTLYVTGNVELNDTGFVKASHYATYSSLKFKENIVDIENPIDTIMNLRGVTFDWKQDGKKDIGFIAEEVNEVMPEIVFKDDSSTGVSSMDYQKMVPLLLEAIKAQQNKIDLLENNLLTLTSAYKNDKK